MTKRISILIVFIIASSYQLNAQNLDNLKAINLVWEQFYRAFETLDYKPMAEIHSKDLVRISGGKRILGYNEYIDNYKTQFEYSMNNQITSQIDLRFFERISSDSVASERGIYRLIRNKGKTNEQAYYGQFHVIFKKLDGKWKITMDYDSSEFDTIGRDDFEKALSITDFESFIKD